MTHHTLGISRETLHGTFSTQWAPVLTIDPGDTVTFETLDASWTIAEPEGDEPWQTLEPRDPVRDDGHALTGPVAVRGAKPGMTLGVRIDALTVGSWGWTIGGGYDNGINERLGMGKDSTMTRMMWSLDAVAGTGTNRLGHTVTLRPFLGVMGMPSEPGTIQHTRPPRITGGNIDCRELIVGTTLYLPIAVEGALFSPGDGHGAQGDGEISSTAIECPMTEATLTFTLLDDMPLTTPVARTADAWMTFGFHESLDEASLIAIDAMLDLIVVRLGISRAAAMALASVVVDLRITQIVNAVRGVHAVLRDDAVRMNV